jgi:xeroderma pigmentosum group C-complementing protein
MLSTRGESYAKAGLANGYLGGPKTPFDKDTKQGVVSFSNAENVTSDIASSLRS